MPRILVDCTRSHLQPEMATGVQRVTRELVARCRDAAPPGWDSLPVYFSHGAWKVARQGRLLAALGRARFLRKAIRARFRTLYGRGPAARLAYLPLWLPMRLAELGVTLAVHALRILIHLSDLRTLVIPRRGDVLFHPEYPLFHMGALGLARHKGVAVVPVIHDILPLTHPHLFARDRKVEGWFSWVSENADAILCVSEATAMAVRQVLSPRTTKVEVFPLGGDFRPSDGAVSPYAPPARRPKFLMVGTVEPRKRHADALAAFEGLWDSGADIELHLIGKPGWMTQGLVARLGVHPEAGRRLFWSVDASDADLEAAYKSAHAVIAASEAEGFGLPVVEALARGTPVIASDIPVFREVAGPFAEYFPMGDVPALADVVRRAAAGPRQPVVGFRWPSWAEATRVALELASSRAHGTRPSGLE